MSETETNTQSETETASGTGGTLILLIEDEPQLRRFLRPMLHSEGYRLIEAETATEGLRQVEVGKPELVLLDLGLPDGDGIEVTRQLRAWTQVPIIVVSARGMEVDKIAAFEAGADDYLIKPFGVPELLARMRVALRHAARAAPRTEAVLVFGELRIDLHGAGDVIGTSRAASYRLATDAVARRYGAATRDGRETCFWERENGWTVAVDRSSGVVRVRLRPPGDPPVRPPD